MLARCAERTLVKVSTVQQLEETLPSSTDEETWLVGVEGLEPPTPSL